MSHTVMAALPRQMSVDDVAGLQEPQVVSIHLERLEFASVLSTF